MILEAYFYHRFFLNRIEEALILTKAQVNVYLFQKMIIYYDLKVRNLLMTFNKAKICLIQNNIKAK
jgi:hypothetical protein